MDVSGVVQVVPIGASGVPVLAPELADFAVRRPLPARLWGVVNDLLKRSVQVVTLADLARYDTGESPSGLAKALRRRGWLEPMRTRGAWQAPFSVDGWRVPGFAELRARLMVWPDTPASVGGKSAADVRGYLARPTRPTVGFPPGVKLPRCLDGFGVARWAPQIAFDEIGGLPVWKNETLLAFMAAKPSQMSWDDVAYWLPDVCWEIDATLLISELAGRHRSVWMKSAFLLKAGGREDGADAVLASAPPGVGPYRFGHWERRRGIFAYPPEWAPKFEIMDYVLAAWWMPKWGRIVP